jgi:hypothetical protein
MEVPVALDLEPDEIYWHALTVVRHAERRLWLLRLKISIRNARQRLRDVWR